VQSGLWGQKTVSEKKMKNFTETLRKVGGGGDGEFFQVKWAKGRDGDERNKERGSQGKNRDKGGGYIGVRFDGGWVS